MTEIILARHGQTAWNVGEVFRGQADIELDETGLKQAQLLAEYLSKRKIEAVFSSPLQRALKTANIIASYHKLEVQVTQGLNDLSFGEWEGLSSQEVQKRYPVIFAQWVTTPHLVKLPGGDALNDLTGRASKLVHEVVNRYQGTVVLVAHRVVHQALILALLGLDNSHFWNISMDTAAITTFLHTQGRFILTGHNNTSYLQSLQK